MTDVLKQQERQWSVQDGKAAGVQHTLSSAEATEATDHG